MKPLAILTGLAILAAATWVVIVGGNLDHSHAVLVAALALGAATGGVVIARSSWRVAVAVGVVVLCSEGYGMAATAERTIRHREALAIEDAKQRPEWQAAARRMDEATAALRAHDAAAVAKSAEKACATTCRAVLEGTRAALVSDIATARDSLALVKLRSSPLADRIGVEPATLDMVMAALLTIGANGLACVLIAWGAHLVPVAPMAAVAVPVAPVVEPVPVASNVVAMRRYATARDATRFAVEHMQPSDGEAYLRDIAAAYWRWCESAGLARPDQATTVAQIGSLVRKAKLETEMRGPDVVVKNVALTG